MSVLSEEKAREELKKLKPGPAQPQAKSSKREERGLEKSSQEVRPAPEAVIRAAETPVGERPPILRELPKPSLAKPQLAPRKLGEALWAPEPSRPAPARVEGQAKTELAPKALRVRLPETRELGELRAPVREPPAEKPALSLKPLKSAIPEVAAQRPAVKLPPLTLKPLQPRIPRAELLKEEKVKVEVSTEEKAESEKAAEEAVTRAEAHVGAALSAASPEAEAKEMLEMEDTALPPFIRALSEVAESSGRPVVLVVPSVRGDSFVSAVAIACREIYRVVKGGKPEPCWIFVSSMKARAAQQPFLARRC